MCNYLFVYGTLLEGEGNHGLLHHARSIAKQAKTKGKLYDTKHGYPMLDIDSEHITYGEVYEVTDQLMWKALDELEGYIHEGHKDNEYDKVVQTVETDQGEFEAVVYVASDRSLLHEFIPSGNWRVWKEDLLEGMLYFAYGSCMDNDRFIKHGVDQHFQDCLGRAVFKGYTLRYNHVIHDGGRADMVEEGGVVEGKLYRVPPEAITYLYGREGVDNNGYRPAIISVEHEGKMVDHVLTFFVLNKEKEVAPPDHYSTEIIRGATGVLSEEYVQKLIEQVHALKNSDVVNN
ncbi:gamma-glutamylcyclotransferase [Priestia aryabhattai]|uniref:gamma-glutamylcyclotransferase n=1 Tax=Priestia TaxID=2800373 RepID=UPI0039831467